MSAITNAPQINGSASRSGITSRPPSRISQSCDRLWDAVDVATFLKTSRSWVYMRAERNEIPFLRIGGLLRFQPSKIREWAASGAAAVRQIR